MKLSITMMVKNEQDNLERCLNSLQPLRDVIDSELIIVDTGSNDNTVQIAKRYTDKIYFHPWNNDFSAMRNISIGYSKGEWIFIIDADEELKEYQELIHFLQSTDSKKYGAIAINCNNFTDIDNLNASSLLVSFRLFKNDGFFHYAGAVHNQPVFKGKELVLAEVLLLHYGYLCTDNELMERKFQRTSAILKSELEKDPENIYYWNQLSVTYGMHKDYVEAVEYAEKAYMIYQKNKPINCMFLFTHMALLYQITKNYNKVEGICLEALTIKDGYIDIYYYLAEAQAVLGKTEQSIANYGKYLNLLDKHSKNIVKDTTIIEYTLGYRELAYFNVSNLYKKVEKYDEALYYAEAIKNEKYSKDNLNTIIFLYMKLGKCDDLRKYYDRYDQSEWQHLFLENLDSLKHEFDVPSNLQLAKVFSNLENEYGLLCNLVVDDHSAVFSTSSQEWARQIKLTEIPIYCSDIFYYLLKYHYSLEDLIADAKEIWLSCILDYIYKQRGDLCEKIYDYLEKYACNGTLKGFKLSKALCRYALILDKLDNIKYRKVFDRYIADGIAYLQAVYSHEVINNILVYEVKNDEEVFLLYMIQAQVNKKANKADYVKGLRSALQAFPETKKGIEMLLHEIQSSNTESSDEFDLYKGQVKVAIKQLIENGNMDEAKNLLAEYKSIVPNDLEVILLESKILLN